MGGASSSKAPGPVVKAAFVCLPPDPWWGGRVAQEPSWVSHILFSLHFKDHRPWTHMFLLEMLVAQ